MVLREDIDSEIYWEFLRKVLIEVATNGSPESVYPLFQNNLDKLDENLALVVQVSARDIFAKVTLDQAHSLAAVIVSFSNLIYQFPNGSKYWNLEIAITGYQAALGVYTETAFPQDWAMTQYNLATAYSDRIKGDKAENLELAIAGYQAALGVRTETAFLKLGQLPKIIWPMLIRIE